MYVGIADIDNLLIGRVQSDSQFAGIAKAGDIILSVIINGHEYSKWKKIEMFVDFIRNNMDKKKTFILLRRNREQVTISSNSKSSPQETSTCQDTDMTSSINVGSKETISINLCEKCFRFGMTGKVDYHTFTCFLGSCFLVLVLTLNFYHIK